MPILIDRRGFLRVAGAATLLTRSLRATAAPMRWALLSDTHIPEDQAYVYRGFRPVENLKTAAAQVSAKSFDTHLVNGDLALRLGQTGDYRRFEETTRPLVRQQPMVLSLGNHDDRANAVAAFGDKVLVSGKWVSAFEAGQFQVVVLDSLFQTNISSGLLGKAQRDWLAAFLDSHADKPVLVFVHHTLDDSDGSLLDSDRFLRIVTQRRQVKAVFFGHSHVYQYAVQDGLHLINQPAVGYNFSDDQPVGWLDAEFSSKGVDLTLHAIGGNRALDGQTKSLEWR